MKCYSFLICLLVSVICADAYATEYTLVALDKEKKSTGDIVEFSVDELDYSKSKTLKNKRINNLLYVLNTYRKNETTILETIISELKKGEEFEELEDIYQVEGLNYKYKEIKLNKEFSIIDNKIVLLESKVLYVILGLLSLLLIVFSVIFLKRRRKIKNEIAERKQRLDVDSNQTSRNHIENIYTNRREVFDLYEIDKDAFEVFEVELNKIQFKKEWTVEESKNIENIFQNFVKTVRDKNGV